MLQAHRAGYLLAAAVLAASAFVAPAAAGSFSVHVKVPPQWRHGQVGTVKLVGVAPPKDPYTTSLILTATKLTCEPTAAAQLARKDSTFIGFVLGGAVSGHFTYLDPHVPAPTKGDHLCAYLEKVGTTDTTIAATSLTWSG